MKVPYKSITVEEVACDFLHPTSHLNIVEFTSIENSEGKIHYRPNYW